MNNTFTVTVKFAPETQVYFCHWYISTGYAHLPLHCKIITDVVARWVMTDDGRIDYLFKNGNFRRSEADVYATPEEAQQRIRDDLTAKLAEWLDRVDHVLDFPIATKL